MALPMHGFKPCTRLNRELFARGIIIPKQVLLKYFVTQSNGRDVTNRRLVTRTSQAMCTATGIWNPPISTWLSNVMGRDCLPILTMTGFTSLPDFHVIGGWRFIGKE